MQERYGISAKDATGQVLWHSLNESGEIGVYDMKFGNTIIRNLTESDIEGDERDHEDEKKHGVQEENDPKRKKP